METGCVKGTSVLRFVVRSIVGSIKLPPLMSLRRVQGLLPKLVEDYRSLSHGGFESRERGYSIHTQI